MDALAKNAIMIFDFEGEKNVTTCIMLTQHSHLKFPVSLDLGRMTIKFRRTKAGEI